MQNKASECRSSDTLHITEIERQAQRWLRDCRVRGHTRKSLVMNQFIVDKLVWFLRREGHEWCGEDELCDFLLYAREGHNDPDGRWGDSGPRKHKPISRRAIKTYYSYLKVFFNWMLRKEVITLSPMRRIDPPECKDDEQTSFSPDQIEKLFEAARKSRQAPRNVAVLALMLDTGARAAEICNIRLCDVDLEDRRISLLGKGVKKRDVYIGQGTTRAIYDYIQDEDRDFLKNALDPLFLSERGLGERDALTASGLLGLFKRLGEQAGLRATRCHPHKMRRTFATEYLNNGAPLKDVQRLMGHTSDKMTMKYLYAAEGRVREHHRNYSPVDRLKRKK